MALTVVKPPAVERRSGLLLDAAVFCGIIALVIGATQVAREWGHPRNLLFEVDLSLRSLPKYALFSFARGWLAYALSLLFTLVVASWAFYDPRARRYILVSLDILQSLPVLSFLPLFEFALVGLFPRSNIGLELVCVLAIFTGQVWNMTFSYYDSLRGAPADFRMLGRLYNLNWWNRFWRIELPFSTQGLLYNSMVSMAGGWFFLMVTEASSVGSMNFRLPGIGSYMAVASEKGDVRAMVYAIIAMSVMIIVVDRLIWWPLIVWARKFKLDDFGTGTARQSRLQLWIARSVATQRLIAVFHGWQRVLLPPPLPPTAETSLVPVGTPPPAPRRGNRLVYWIGMALLLGFLAWGVHRLVMMLLMVPRHEWLVIFRDAAFSFIRVLAAVVLGTAWTVPFGVWIGLNPKLSSRLQPVIQFVASFPSPMIYPALLFLVFAVGGNLQWGSVLLILFGTQWYILFNVAGAAAAIPNDMIACSRVLHLSGWARWKVFLLPAILPGLVTGWVTAAGGAWNTTIVAEALTVHGKNYVATGLGSYIAGITGGTTDYARLTAASLVMALIVVVVNRTVWKRLQLVAVERCRFMT